MHAVIIQPPLHWLWLPLTCWSSSATGSSWHGLSTIGLIIRLLNNQVAVLILLNLHMHQVEEKSTWLNRNPWWKKKQFWGDGIYTWPFKNSKHLHYQVSSYNKGPVVNKWLFLLQLIIVIYFMPATVIWSFPESVVPFYNALNNSMATPLNIMLLKD